MEDIDLLLPRADHARALSALAAAGWTVARAAEGEQYDTVLTHPEVPSLFLELHFGLETASQRVTALDPVTLWARRQPAVVASTPAFVLPPNEELVVLAAHAGKPHHGFVRLVWIADIAMIVRDAASDGNPIDWERVRAVAASTHCVTVVGAALAMARRAGVDAPAGMFPLPTRGWRGAAMRQLLSVSWPLTHLELPGYRLNYALTDDRMQRLKILLVLRGVGLWHRRACAAYRDVAPPSVGRHADVRVMVRISVRVKYPGIPGAGDRAPRRSRPPGGCGRGRGGRTPAGRTPPPAARGPGLPAVPLESSSGSRTSAAS